MIGDFGGIPQSPMFLGNNHHFTSQTIQEFTTWCIFVYICLHLQDDPKVGKHTIRTWHLSEKNLQTYSPRTLLLPPAGWKLFQKNLRKTQVVLCLFVLLLGWKWIGHQWCFSPLEPWTDRDDPSTEVWTTRDFFVKVMAQVIEILHHFGSAVFWWEVLESDL